MKQVTARFGLVHYVKFTLLFIPPTSLKLEMPEDFQHKLVAKAVEMEQLLGNMDQNTKTELSRILVSKHPSQLRTGRVELVPKTERGHSDRAESIRAEDSSGYPPASSECGGGVLGILWS